MLTIAICDDNLLFAGQALTAMDKILEPHAVPHQISTFQSGKALLAGGFFDIVFLDIQMEGQNGLEIAQILRREKNPCHIIFLTSHKEYVFAAFDVSATHYLLKPMDIDKLGAVLMSIVDQLAAETQQCYTVKCGSQVHAVPFAKIQFVEVLGRKISLHTEEKVYSFNGRLDEVAEAFVRQGQLIITIKNSKPPDVTVTNGIVFPKEITAYHGLGLDNVRATVEKYGGIFDLSAGEAFVFSVLLPTSTCDTKHTTYSKRT